MKRRAFLHAAAAALPAGALTPAIALGASSAVRFGYSGLPCETPIVAGSGAKLFAAAGLDVGIVRVAPDAIVRAMRDGHIDAATGNLATWLPALASGDARVAAGLHAGCLRLLGANGSGVTSLAHAHGATIVTERLGSPAMLTLSALLAKRGLDPRSDVRWVAAGDAIAQTISAGGAQIVAASDPQAFALFNTGAAAPLDDLAGGLSCGPDPAHDHQCFLVLRTGFAQTAAAVELIRATINATWWVAGSIERAAHMAADPRYAGGNETAIGAALASYDWKPSRTLTLEEVALTARDFTRAGLLATALDPATFAQRAVTV